MYDKKIGTQCKIHNGIKRITSSEDGNANDISNSWGGLLAKLLRKIISGNYDGKGIPGCEQYQDQRIDYATLVEKIKKSIIFHYGTDIKENKLNELTGRILRMISENDITIKTFGDFIHILDLASMDITITIHNKKGEVIPYSVKVGGAGFISEEREKLTPERIKKLELEERSKIEIGEEHYSIATISKNSRLVSEKVKTPRKRRSKK